jgi:corrinoid protein of di/trimethylamine methyltransferase
VSEVKKGVESPLSEEKILDKLIQAIINGDEAEAKKMTEEALAAGMNPSDVVKQGAVKAMDIIGEKWRKFEIFLSHVMLAAEAMKSVMAILLPKIAAEQKTSISYGKVVLGTVSGDIHDIGKNIVATLLSVAGFEVYDIGVDIPSKDFIEKAKEFNADIIAMSCLLSTSMYFQRDVIQYLKDASLREKYYVIVGGGPVTADWASEIGADGWGKYADDAVTVCKKLVTGGVRPPLSKPILVGE